MQRFAQLFRRLDETTKTSRKVEAMREYFASAAPADGAWAVHFLCGRRLNRLVLTRNLAGWCLELAGLPAWLFDECHEAVGDLAETMALLLPASTRGTDRPLHAWVEEVIVPLATLPEDAQRAALVAAWQQLSPLERLVFNKLVTGSFRVGVSHGLVVRALAEVAGLNAPVVAHRLMGNWQPTADFFVSLLTEESGAEDLSRPYPFCLAHPLTGDPQELGEFRDWFCEWKWDGIRSQMIRRQGQSFLWSRGEELILDRFPDLEVAASHLPEGTTLDGEIVGWKEDRVLPFSDLQRRIGRKKLTSKILSEVPASFIAFDVLQHAQVDVRDKPFHERRAILTQVVRGMGLDARLQLSPQVPAESWQDLAARRSQSREQGVEGIMLKRRDSAYGSGRLTGLWWKWKIDPFSCDAVLVYAQRGHGRRASLYTDYTFAVWHEGKLVPFAKAYSGLTDEEIHEVDRFVRQNSLEKFGPVRVVKPELVFEVAFEGIQRSARHKSGVAVRFPRMVRWRRDKHPADADSLDTLERLLGDTHQGPESESAALSDG
jgi:DNA ligase-1